MAAYTIQASFSRGEASPRLYSRSDLEYFKAWLKVCQNWTVMRQGGLTRRPGTEFIAEVKNSAKKVRLVPFIFSSTQAYVLELGDQYFRVYANGGRVGSVEVAAPWLEADLFSLDYDQTNDVLDAVHQAYAPQRIARASDTSWSVDATKTFDGPYLDVNVTPTIITPSATGNAIPTLTSNTSNGTASVSSTDGSSSAYQAFDGSASTAWQSANGDVSGAYLQYTPTAGFVPTGYSIQSSSKYTDANKNGINWAPKSWTFEGYDGSNWIILDTQYGQTGWGSGESRFFLFNNSASFSSVRLVFDSVNGDDNVAIASFTVQRSPATAAAITLTASATAGINGGAGFQSTDVGRDITIVGGDAIYHSFQIASVTSTTVVTAKLTGAPLPVIKGTAQWKLGAWSSTGGWPSSVSTFEGRKAFASQPNRIDLTKAGGYGAKLDFSVRVPIQDDDAISLTLTDVNPIQWLAEGQDLGIGTLGAVRTIGRDSANLPFSATNFRQARASTVGSAPVRPAQSAGSVLFLAAFAKAIRELTKDANSVDYIAPDISILSDHLFASQVVEMTYQQEPDSTFWFVRTDGNLVGLTFEKEQSMAGMHQHAFGGVVESACTIPGADRHETWMVIRRTINGSTKRYIERLAKPFDGTRDAQEDAWHLDCALRYSGAPVNQVTNLGHLNGETVQIYADGAREPDQVVSGGVVNLTSGATASKILVGKGFSSRAKTMSSTLAVGDGSGLGRPKKIVKAMVDVLATGSLKVGRNQTTAEEIILRKTTGNLGQAVPLSHGFHDARFDSRWSDGGEIEMIADGPFPATVRSLTLHLEPSP